MNIPWLQDVFLPAGLQNRLNTINNIINDNKKLYNEQ